MLIGRDRFPEHCQIGIAIANCQVAQNLVVGAVFLENENHVLNALMHGRHDSGVVGAVGVGEVVVREYLRSQRCELRRAGARNGLKTGFNQLRIILIRRIAIRRIRRPVAAIAPAGIRTRWRLPIDRVHQVAIGAEAD